MADTEPALFTPADAEACMALSVEAGWNQTPADWAMMLRIGFAPGRRGADGVPVASALALPMAGGIGWISMVLVTQSLRRRGIAQALVGKCIDWLEARGIRPVLDATPAGQPLYLRMGFAPLCKLTRMQGQGGGDMPDDPAIRIAAPADAGRIAALDRQVFGAGRPAVIANILARPGAVALMRGDDAFVLSRSGQTATQIGPLVAPDPQTALTLLDAALARHEGPLLIDTFDAQPAVADHLRARGFTAQRPYLRMGRGLTRMPGDPARHYAAAGPELG